MATENEEKRELLKLKQGLIDDSEIIDVKTEKEEKPKLKGWKWVANFWYHNKWFIIVGIFIAAVTSFMTWQLLTREAADATVLLITSNNQRTPDMYRRVNDFEKALEMYCPDFDGNGNIHVDVYFIDLDKNYADVNYINANSTKFFGEMERGIAHLFICDNQFMDTDEHAYSESEFSSMFLDLSVIMDDEAYKGQHYIQLNQTALAGQANWENSCPNSMRIGVKKETPDMIGYSEQSLKHNENAQVIMKNIINKNVINEMKK